MIVAYCEPDKQHGRQLMQAVIDSVSAGVPAALVEVRKLGRTLKRHAGDILAYFERPGTNQLHTAAPFANDRFRAAIVEHLDGTRAR